MIRSPCLVMVSVELFTSQTLMRYISEWDPRQEIELDLRRISDIFY